MQEYGATRYKNTGPDVQVYGTVHSSIRYQFKYTGQRRDVDPSSDFGTRVLEFSPFFLFLCVLVVRLGTTATKGIFGAGARAICLPRLASPFGLRLCSCLSSSSPFTFSTKVSAVRTSPVQEGCNRQLTTTTAFAASSQTSLDSMLGDDP